MAVATANGAEVKGPALGSFVDDYGSDFLELAKIFEDLRRMIGVIQLRLTSDRRSLAEERAAVVAERASVAADREKAERLVSAAESIAATASSNGHPVFVEKTARSTTNGGAQSMPESKASSMPPMPSRVPPPAQKASQPAVPGSGAQPRQSPSQQLSSHLSLNGFAPQPKAEAASQLSVPKRSPPAAAPEQHVQHDSSQVGARSPQPAASSPCNSRATSVMDEQLCRSPGATMPRYKEPPTDRRPPQTPSQSGSACSQQVKPDTKARLSGPVFKEPPARHQVTPPLASQSSAVPSSERCAVIALPIQEKEQTSLPAANDIVLEDAELHDAARLAEEFSAPPSQPPEAESPHLRHMPPPPEATKLMMPCSPPPPPDSDSGDEAVQTPAPVAPMAQSKPLVKAMPPSVRAALAAGLPTATTGAGAESNSHSMEDVRGDLAQPGTAAGSDTSYRSAPPPRYKAPPQKLLKGEPDAS
mmetsp:Transcript_47287/g.106239  ORF Transcript_47287/g.106239 Transcript_47287/m.106239 type:complete len:474 (-) Transcript_47287:55-1476(-)